MKVNMNKKEKPEVDEVVEFLESLTEEEKQGFLYFIQGFKYRKSLEKVPA